MLQFYGVTGPQRYVLRLLGDDESLSAGDLASILNNHPSTLTGVLRRLEANGFLTRRADPQDRRRAVLRLTQRGEAIRELTSGTIEASVIRASANLTVEDLETTERVLRTIMAAIDTEMAGLGETREP